MTRAGRPAQAGGAPWRWGALFAASGGLALGVQAILLREVMVALQGDEAALGLGLAAWLAGIALGTLPGRWLARRSARGTATGALVLLALSGWLGVVLARVGRLLLGAPVGELLTFGPSLALTLAVLALPGALVGVGFVALAAAASQDGVPSRRALAQLYVLEAVGSLASGLLVSLLLIPRLAPFGVLPVLAAVALALALPAARAGLVRGRWVLPLALVGTSAAALPAVAGRIEAATQRLRFASLVAGLPLRAWDDTPYEHVALGGGDVRSLYASGRYVASFPDPIEDEGRAHRLMLLAERPARVLALGGLETGMLRFCLEHPVERLDLVQLDRRAFELVRRYLDPLDQEALASPRVRLVFDDPRSFLARGHEPYDLIVSLGPDPSTLLLARVTTAEFDALVAARLAPSGVYVTRFSAGPNTQAGETGLLGASLHRSLTQAFGVVLATPGPDALFVAGQDASRITLDAKRLGARWRERGLVSEVFVPQLLSYAWPRERVASLARQLRDAEAAPTRDDRPVSFLHALVVRQQVAGSAWAPLLAWAARHPRELVAAALAPSGLFVLGLLALRPRRARHLAALHATAVVGASGMAWSLMLFFSFQTRVGALYSQIGALSALFMLGLAAGGAWAGRVVDQRGALWRAQIVTLAISALLAAALPALGWLSAWHAALALVHVLLLGLAGVATGVVFPSAAALLLADGAEAAAAARSVELGDHAGAAFAALFAAVLFVPLLGLVRTALLLVALQAVALAATGLAGRLPATRA